VSVRNEAPLRPVLTANIKHLLAVASFTVLSFVSLEASISREQLTSKGCLTAGAYGHFFGTRSGTNCFSESHPTLHAAGRINHMDRFFGLSGLHFQCTHPHYLDPA